jgi:uncharacterized protein YbcC (UPF0753/DUF2309 family)
MTTSEAPPAAAPLRHAEGESVAASLREAAARIAPVWPLESFVAVNPYLGLTDLPRDAAFERLAATAGAHSTLPVAWYLDALEDGRIDVSEVAPDVVQAARADVARGEADVAVVPTVADVATRLTGRDWEQLATGRVAAWAAAYFDSGQASWRSVDPTLGVFRAWRDEATLDRTPEVMGLKGFRRTVADLPDDFEAASATVLHELGVPVAAREVYLHRLLLRVGGWSAFAARLGFEAALVEREDDSLQQFTAVLLAWEMGIYRAFPDGELTAAWSAARASLLASSEDRAVRGALARRLELHDALERSEQRRIITQLAGGTDRRVEVRPEAQAVFCIDVRSEVFRRHLEAVDEQIDTLGFAGFFGVPIDYVPLAHSSGGAQCPVLLTPAYTVAESVADEARRTEAVASRRLSHQVRNAWKSFKMGAISCFSFVGPVGLAYLPKLFTDGHGWTRPSRRPESEGLPDWAVAEKGPTLEPIDNDAGDIGGIPLESRIELAAGVLRAMSLTDGFAPIVLLTGHGASTTNNPYDTALDCGACGGRPGEANSRVTALIMNDPEVRSALADRGIGIPADTWFAAGQHDTTTDEVVLFDRAAIPAEHTVRIERIVGALAEAGRRSRAERAPRMGIADAGSVDDEVIRRSTDWAQVRPEWGLAGCSAFIAAPRHRTLGADLGGRSFLHSYAWRQDEGFGVLELIMTAPMVVASWISLQYYASTVDNELFGSGNKTLHNVVGRVGVVEGNGGDLRTGLPWQSVHDGEDLQHLPQRLNVIIEAPIEAMSDVLARHEGVRDLCDHGWVHLWAMGEDGRVAHRYVGDLRWEDVGVAS